MQPVRIGPIEILKSSGTARMKLIKLFDFWAGSILATLVKAREEKATAGILVKSILIIRPGGIGDAVFLLPFLRELAAQNPEIAVDILCEKRNAQIFRSQPGLCRNVFLYDDLESVRSLFIRQRFWRDLAKTKFWRAIHYSLIIDTEQWHYLSALVAYILNPELTVGFATRPLRTKLFNQKIAYEIDAYEIENFKKLFLPVSKACEGIRDINGCYQVPAECTNWAEHEIPKESITLFLGGSIPERRLERTQSLEIIRHILDKGFHPVLLGGRDVLETSVALENEINDSRLKNFVGKISLAQSAALIKRSPLFIGTDSGLMHLACAVGTPVIAIFGPGNLKKWGPQGSRHTVITEALPCSPCTMFGYTISVCHSSSCLQQIKVNNITSAIEKAILL